MIRLNCVEIGNFSCISIIERVCKVHASERMNDCPVVGGRKYDVKCDGVRWGPIGSRWGPIGSRWGPMWSDVVRWGPIG